MTLKHIVVGGGTGFIGTEIIKQIIRNGARYTCVSRMPGPNRISWQEVESSGLPKDITAVINVAGQNILDPKQRWSQGFKQNVVNSRVQTTAALAKAIVHTKARAFVTISGVAYYKPNNTEYTEESKCEKYDFLSKLCHNWEEAARLPEGCGIRQTTIRSGVVLGRDGGMIKQLYLPFLFGMGGPIGDGSQYMPWIHVEDLANMFLFAIENNNVHGILNGVSPQVVTNKEFADTFASKMHRPAFVPMPGLVVNILFGKERGKLMLEGQKVLPKRVQELGFKYKYPDMQSACTELTDKSTMKGN